MPLEIEDRVRAAALAKVDNLRKRYGGRIPRDRLSEGVEINGTRVPIWNRYRGIHKPEIFGRDGAALTIQTSADSPYDDTHDRDAGVIGYKYQGQDPNAPNNVALRHAALRRVPLIYLIAVDPGYYDAITPVYVIEDDPSRLQFTLQADLSSIGEIASDQIATAVRREYQTRAVLQRLHQQQFRRIVLRAYKNRCAICHLKHLELLDAAHILPDRDPRGEPIVTNGLGLCKIHHSAYDSNIIGIDPDVRVHVRHDILNEVDGPMLKHGIQGVDGLLLRVPRQPAEHPNREFLAERFDRFKAA